MLTPVKPWNAYVKARRLKRGFSLENLHNVSGIPVAQLSKIENRTKPPTFVQAMKLAQIFACDPITLFCVTTGLARTIREVEAVA